ncbi:MAG TPA: response regulator [Puia sp.]|nr:response regulator [Puia sp.]
MDTEPMTQTGKIVLIVDDSAIIIERLVQMLENLEKIQQVIIADSYAMAVSRISETKPDLAILDINLPDKSGIELLRYIKNNMAEIKVIMLTNQADEYYRNLCKRLGSAYFIDKSGEIDKTPAIISSLL